MILAHFNILYSEHIYIFYVPRIHTEWRHLAKVNNKDFALTSAKGSSP